MLPIQFTLPQAAAARFHICKYTLSGRANLAKHLHGRQRFSYREMASRSKFRTDLLVLGHSQLHRSDSDLGGLVPWTQETRMRNAEEATMLAYVFALKWTATFSNLL